MEKVDEALLADVIKVERMAIWCPDADGRVESLTFASPGYYEKE